MILWSVTVFIWVRLNKIQVFVRENTTFRHRLSQHYWFPVETSGTRHENGFSKLDENRSGEAAADLGGNCCADLEERIAELEATTARKGNRKVSLTIYGWVAQQVMW